MRRTSGIIEQYHPSKRWGYIRADDFERLFFHRGGILNAEAWTPRAGERVIFDRELGPKGPRAFHVHRTEASGGTA